MATASGVISIVDTTAAGSQHHHKEDSSGQVAMRISKRKQPSITSLQQKEYKLHASASSLVLESSPVPGMSLFHNLIIWLFSN